MSMTAVLPQPILARPRSAVITLGWRRLARSRAAVDCSGCYQRRACLSSAFPQTDLDGLNQLISGKRRIERDATLYRVRDRFDALYVVHSGAFKTVGRLTHGEEKITGFFLPGELINLDAIDSAEHGYDAIALEDSEVCVIPFARLEAAALKVPALRHEMFRLLSRDISRDQGLMLLLGVMTAEQRLAAFVLNLSQRYKRLGFSPDRFTLRMTREEIGSYLGLTLETVSRQFSRLQRNGLLAVEQREIEVRNRPALMEMAGY